MDLLTGLTTYIQKENLFSPDQKILLATSGGVDSVVMAHLFKQAGLPFAIAHCNFQLRGDESVRDESFVTTLAATLGVPFFSVRFDTADYATEKRVSIQVAARELRYEWLETTRKASGCAYIATAHHMQDNVETVLMNICKGTGISGLHGILPRQTTLVRPLLFTQKKDLLAYATEHNISYVEDSSNITIKYTRNFFRHQIIPVMQEAYPGVVNNIAAGIERFREAEELYSQSVIRHKKRLLSQKGNTWMIAVLRLQKTVPLHTIAWEIFRDFGCSSAQLPQVLELLHSTSGRLVETASHRIIRDRQWLLITTLAEQEAPLIVIEKERTHVVTTDGHLKIKEVSKTVIPTAANIACLDKHTVQYPLLLRRWKQGDYFYPLGMRKKKKVSRFFIDQKLSLLQKEKIWVLESGKRIVWVIGMRIDDRFKITDSTKDMLLLEWSAI
ncbi:tRNA lysidine(34) synthetase TilS [Chitinophaga oryziterrae]|uniref:tRNA(Ile)-lysidine synthase n=1 Tax=Chitinophaga oryziterrae TaxID=1031224 RepID=A0A6N8JJL8_9BACT|nr:tRNA lysidine(34) synthetase TilS [Chitinophaga oryziterrae]MVT44576.1 tRNA lysidine(34) synthetase TilS [Chitinophaga oryziterrae]